MNLVLLTAFTGTRGKKVDSLVIWTRIPPLAHTPISALLSIVLVTLV
jgi:hypothetical protein